MQFELSETQQAIKDAAREFFSNEVRIADVRRLIEAADAFDAGLWRKCAEQGYTAMIFPEAYGGVGLGLVEMAATLEEMGRALLPGPFVSTVLSAGTLVAAAGSEAQKQSWLAPICRGDARATLALLERSASWDRDAVQLETKEVSGGYELNGEKLFVADAAVADLMVVAGRVGGSRELALLMVPAGTAGVQIALTPAVDLTRRLYRVTFDQVQVSSERLLARGAAADAALDRSLDVTAVGLAAEMVGGMQQLLDLTVTYAKTRSQFGRPIGSFQAVQHRAVDLFALLEGSRSATYYAAWALSQEDPNARLAVSVAKAYASDGYREAGNIAIQVHGGMGFTWENDAHLYYRRAKGSELACGDATFHRERIGRALLARGGGGELRTEN
jgi:alkylation response protein AidB-like acyl-CoA dehydrogenase